MRFHQHSSLRHIFHYRCYRSFSSQINIHNDKIIEQFTLQAAKFAEVPGHLDSIDMLIHMAKINKTSNVLDVACGPGIVSCEFAKHCNQVTGTDVTKRMLEEASKRQQKLKLENLTWISDDVTNMKFQDNSFSHVITRYSFHHILNPQLALYEMMRVCQPSGRILIADVIQQPHTVTAYDQLEKIRDPSHVHALTKQEWEALISSVSSTSNNALGTQVSSQVIGQKMKLVNVESSFYKVNIGLNEILQASFPNPGDENVIRNMFEKDLASGIDSLGINIHNNGSEIRYEVPIIVLAADVHKSD